MDDAPGMSDLVRVGKCSWCVGPVGLFYPQTEGVCAECLVVLTRAGVSHAEIYRGDKQIEPATHTFANAV